VTTLRRGDIVIVDLNPTRGSEQRVRGPVLSSRNDVGNASAPTTIIVPFTTSSGARLYPFEVPIPAEECALREDSVALCSQIHTIDERIRDRIGSIPDEGLSEVDRALEYSLGLRGPSSGDRGSRPRHRYPA
jgi:mRNA interferase MazF